MSKPASIHTFVSYKGGTGRTTACANVAYQAALQGKRVLVVDLDVDGPGMAVLAGISPEEMKTRSIVKYLLEGPQVAPADYVIRREFAAPGGGKVAIDFLAAPASYEPGEALPTFGDTLSGKMVRFRNELRLKYDLIFIDSASGVSDYTALAFIITDFVTICFRWSRQHVLGSVNLIRLLNGIRQKRRAGANLFLQDYALVASAVPAPRTGPEHQRRDDVLAQFRDIMDRFKERPAGQTEEIGLIGECDDLKWHDCVVTWACPVFSEYATVAAGIIGQHDKYEGGA